MTTRKPVNLALQGGGAHGAFTWGVLDRLLEDDQLAIEAISGTSAGAMNAVVAVDGLMRGGTDGARAALHDFWKAVSDAALLSPVQRTPLDRLLGNWNLDDSPGFLALDVLSRVASPYQLNPLRFNPLRDLLAARVDFERVRCCTAVKLFISATNVRTGRVKVWDRDTLTLDMVMASACLPSVFHAVEVDGEPYWDGGYMGNPVLFPFFRRCVSPDIVIVQINPVERAELPVTARDIHERIDEITFNASLLKELRAIDFVHRLLDAGQLDESRYRRVYVHLLEAQDELNPLGASSKLNTEWAFLRHLFDIGRRAADDWLSANFAAIGEGSSVDLRAMFAGVSQHD